MKNLYCKLLMFVCVIWYSHATAQQTTTASSDGFFIRNGATYYIKAGTVNPVNGLQDLGNGRTIDGRGVIKNADGTHVQLKEGEMADLTGTMSATRIQEHIEIQNGKVVIVTNGIATPINGALKLSTGETVDEFGNITNGTALKAGEKIDMNGNKVK